MAAACRTLRSRSVLKDNRSRKGSASMLLASSRHMTAVLLCFGFAQRNVYG